MGPGRSGRDVLFAPGSVDGTVHASEGRAQWRRRRWRMGVGGCQGGLKEAVVDAGDGQCRPEAEGCDAVSVGFWDAFDEAVEPEATQVVGHLALAEMAGR